MNTTSKRIISIGSDDSKSFFKTRGIGKHSEIGSFSTIKVPVDAVTEKLYEDD